jgi:hypothetical protein
MPARDRVKVFSAAFIPGTFPQASRKDQGTKWKS